MAKVEYRGATIEPHRWPHGKITHEWYHEDYDASYEGEGGTTGSWSDNGLCGMGTSVEDCKQQVDEALEALEEEWAEYEKKRAK